MSFFNTKNALGNIKLDGFGGIDTSTPAKGEGKASEITNFRILPDGSLKKRKGFLPRIESFNNIRATYGGYFDGVYKLYYIVQNILSQYDPVTMELKDIGTIRSVYGNVSIFRYLGKLYIADGWDIYEVGENSVTSVAGYAPLLGKDWGSSYPGEINEPLNLLTPHARISYIVTDEASIFLATLYPVKSVEAVYINGERIATNRYYIDSDYVTVNVGGMNNGDKVLIYLTFDTAMISRNELVQNTEAMVFGGINNSRIFMWGGTKKNVMFASGAATNENIREAEVEYPNSGGIYFPVGSDFTVGDGGYDITAVERHYDRLLIFTTEDVWMANSEECGVERFPTMRINARYGCASAGGVAKCGNDPISVGRDRIYRWTSNTDALEECNAYVISDPIASLLPEGFFENAIVYEDKFNREVLFRKKGDTRGRVFIYNQENSQWYSFIGINADYFFDAPDGVGFVSGKSIFFFDDTLTEDWISPEATRGLSAVYVTNNIDFGLPYKTKRLMAMTLNAELGKTEELRISFNTDNGSIYTYPKGKKHGVESLYSRLNSPRFKKTSITLTESSEYPQRIFGLSVVVKP